MQPAPPSLDLDRNSPGQSARGLEWVQRQWWQAMRLLSLLALNVRGIRIGPAAPAFVSPNVFKVLQDKYDLKLTTAGDPLADLNAAYPLHN